MTLCDVNHYDRQACRDAEAGGVGGGGGGERKETGLNERTSKLRLGYVREGRGETHTQTEREGGGREGGRERERELDRQTDRQTDIQTN